MEAFHFFSNSETDKILILEFSLIGPGFKYKKAWKD